MIAEIITIGDELLIGQVINTNQAFIAESLNAIGVRVARMITVGDDEERILHAYMDAWQRVDIIVVTGGLGPTHDDVTKKTLCRFFTTDLVSHPDVRRDVESMFRKRNLAWNPAAEEQTMIPRGAGVIQNVAGTAPGMTFDRDGRLLVVMPGVPYEMKEMMTRWVLPQLKTRVGGQVIHHTTLRTAGISESLLATKLGKVDSFLQGASLAFLPSLAGVRLRITVHDNDTTAATRKSEEIETHIRAVVGKYIYAKGDEELEQAVGTLLRDRGLTIAVAESCTGGLLADRITDCSGSSAYFERGLIVYSNRSKTELLGIPEDLIHTHGAVSKEVALAMAESVRSRSGTDIGISTTGIAGPTGGTPDKPVGLVWIGLADSRGSIALRFHFGDHRQRTKERATYAALELIRRRILRIEQEGM